MISESRVNICSRFSPNAIKRRHVRASARPRVAQTKEHVDSSLMVTQNSSFQLWADMSSRLHVKELIDGDLKINEYGNSERARYKET